MLQVVAETNKTWKKTGHKNKDDYSRKGDACFKLTIYDSILIV